MQRGLGADPGRVGGITEESRRVKGGSGLLFSSPQPLHTGRVGDNRVQLGKAGPLSGGGGEGTPPPWRHFSSPHCHERGRRLLNPAHKPPSGSAPLITCLKGGKAPRGRREAGYTRGPRSPSCKPPLLGLPRLLCQVPLHRSQGEPLGREQAVTRKSPQQRPPAQNCARKLSY